MVWAVLFEMRVLLHTFEVQVADTRRGTPSVSME